ncbi:MAG: hypothetical protein A2030_05005 [Chloroflexi bacterium RBG_19FT_COMBO_50_10]|nr:MAG: hypothetical protein A2030_05005 [Chloroflexi bacterium RBG_19FT_COMBO_50_10]
MEGDYLALRTMDGRPEMHIFERELTSEDETHKSLDEFIRDQQESPRINFRFAITIPPQDT